MKTLKITSIVLLIMFGLASCEKDIFLPPVDNGPVCASEISPSDLNYIKDKIDQAVYKDEKLSRGLNLTRSHCYKTPQVIEIIDLYVYRDDKLEMAKHLYHHTTDKHMYYDVVDELAYKSDRDELSRYIENN